MLELKHFLRTNELSQAQLARDVGVSPALIAELLNKEKWPTRPPKDALQASILAALAGRGVEANASIFESCASVDALAKEDAHVTEQAMLLRKQTLLPATKKHFEMFQDPFEHDVESSEDVFLTPTIRYVREYLWTSAKFGGSFVAIVSESGGGKSTLRRDLNERIAREEAPILIVEPYVIGMEDKEKDGKPMKASSIVDAIIHGVAPLETPRASMEAKCRQMHRLLKDSRRAGRSHCVVIEEAHRLSIATLKHLKGLLELEDGFKKLLSVVLLGQPELKKKLRVEDPYVREVVQRCELIELPPLDAALDEYLKFKLNRVGIEMGRVFAPNALDGLRARLIVADSSSARKQQSISLLYPQMIHNVVRAALNDAASLGFERISADLFKEVR